MMRLCNSYLWGSAQYHEASISLTRNGYKAKFFPRIYSVQCYVKNIIDVYKDYNFDDIITMCVKIFRDPEPLKAFSNADVLLKLPYGVKVRDIKWLSVWCRRFTVSYLDTTHTIRILYTTT